MPVTGRLRTASVPFLNPFFTVPVIGDGGHPRSLLSCWFPRIIPALLFCVFVPFPSSIFCNSMFNEQIYKKK